MTAVPADLTAKDHLSTVAGATHGRRSPKTALAVYTFCVLAYVAAIWSYRYIPTCDGPAHLASAVTWARLDEPQTRYGEFYVFTPRQLPNLTSQFVLAGLVRLVHPLTAEKILVTIYIVGLAAAFWYFATAFGGDARWTAPLSLLFLFHLAFFFGFYNYCLSLIAFWYVTGYCARHSTSLGAADALKLAGALMAAYVTHLVGWILSLIAVFWFCGSLRGRRTGNWIYVAVAAAPSSLLAVHYSVRTSMVGRNDVPVAIGQALRHIRIAGLEQRLASLGENVFGPLAPSGAAFGCAVFVCYEFMIAAAFLSQVGRCKAVCAARALALATLLLVAYFVLPDDFGRHGGLLVLRLGFLPPMLVVPLLRLPKANVGRYGILALIYGTLLVNLASSARLFQHANADIEEYVAGADVVGRDAALFTATPPDGSYWPLHLWHAAGYYCLTTANIALGNTETSPGPFWIQFRDGVLVGRGDFEHYLNKSVVDYVLVWRDRSFPLIVPAGCRELFSQGRLHVFATRASRPDVHRSFRDMH